MRTYDRRRPNMEIVPYGARAKHPEHTAEYRLSPEAAAPQHIAKAAKDLAAVQDRLHGVMQAGGISAATRAALQAAYQKVGLARGDLEETRSRR